MSWVGFTDEELKRLKREQFGEDDLEKQPTVYRPSLDHKRSSLNSAAGKRQRPREKLRTRNTGNTKTRSREDGEEMRRMPKVQTGHCTVQRLEEERESSSPECEKSEPVGQRESESPSKQIVSSSMNGKPEEIEGCSGIGVSPEPEVRVIDEPERIKAMELSALQRMQQKQREMEEENKKKTVVLQEMIKKRYKKTQAETQTLTMVQKELSHLDNLLSADVRILRDQIDHACKDYLYAQKRYERTESEFIAAKLNLHQKTERKELLTEHLCTVIQANEQRKANKLEALMVKLDLSQDSIEMQGEKTESRCEDTENRYPSQAGDLCNIPEETVAEKKAEDSNKGDIMPCDGGNASLHLETVQSERTGTTLSSKESHDVATTAPPTQPVSDGDI